MKIENDCAVTLKVKVADSAARVLDEGRDPTVYLHGGYDNIFAKIEGALEGQEPGYQLALTLAAEDAFGARDESLLRSISKKDFPPGVKVGGQLHYQGDDGTPQMFYVQKIKGDAVHLDGNHPWAGKELRFTIKVVEVRRASPEEIAHRHVHGEHGHHH